MSKINSLHLFGLIGYPLSHSFSKKYFSQKFKREGIENHAYELFPLQEISALPELLAAQPNLKGLNVTIPYKEQVIPFLDDIDEEAKAVGAVNTIRIENGKLTGYNTDIYGFEHSLLAILPIDKKGNKIIPSQALILGTGGAAKAIAHVLKKWNINILWVSRNKKKGDLTYNELTHKTIKNNPLIVNTTPLGMSPNTNTCPSIPYEALSEINVLYDLVYNPEKTLFLARGEAHHATIKNGLEMLHLQAEKAWDIWRTNDAAGHE